MAFVKDDHSYTRGAGAIAAMDAASPRRRIAMARADRALRVREALTQGAIDRGYEGDRPAGSSRPVPPRPPGPGRRPVMPRPPFTGGVRPTGVRAGVSGPRAELVKLPGTVITPGAREGKPVQGATGTQAPSEEIKATEPPAPPKPPPRQVIVSGGGGGFMPVSPKPTAPPPWMPEISDELDVELEEAPAELAPQVSPAPAPAPKSSSKLPLYAGIALLAYLLTR